MRPPARLLIALAIVLLGPIGPCEGRKKDRNRERERERERSRSRQPEEEDIHLAGPSAAPLGNSSLVVASPGSLNSARPDPTGGHIDNNWANLSQHHTCRCPGAFVAEPSAGKNVDYMKSAACQNELQVGCQELRSKRYISDGFCTSIKPITEVVCTGHCLPVRDLPWYAEFIKVWATTKVLEWRCVEDVVRRKRVTLMCENGEQRTYRIKVVKSCKCKRYMRQQNQSAHTRRKRKGRHRRKDPELNQQSDDPDRVRRRRREGL